VLPQLLHNLLGYIIQHTTYLLSRGLLSRILRSVCLNCFKPTNHSYCTTTLRCDPSDHNTTLSHTNWQVGFVLRSAPPVTLCPLALPLRALKRTFFPTHLLHCYNHRSRQWWPCCQGEQACVNELLPAELRRLTSFGNLTALILRTAGRTMLYRTLRCPKYLLCNKLNLLSMRFGKTVWPTAVCLKVPGTYFWSTGILPGTWIDCD
jgi:hypothetical protein